MKVIISAKNECHENNIRCCECNSVYNTGSCTDTCYPDFANVTRNDYDSKKEDE